MAALMRIHYPAPSHSGLPALDTAFLHALKACVAVAISGAPDAFALLADLALNLTHGAVRVGSALDGANSSLADWVVRWAVAVQAAQCALARGPVARNALV